MRIRLREPGFDVASRHRTQHMPELQKQHLAAARHEIMRTDFEKGLSVTPSRDVLADGIRMPPVDFPRQQVPRSRNKAMGYPRALSCHTDEAAEQLLQDTHCLLLIGLLIGIHHSADVRHELFKPRDMDRMSRLKLG